LQRHRFNVFGRIFVIQREGARWQAYAVGADGKRSPAGFVVPEFIGEHELAQYLGDLFHESATPTNGEVRKIECVTTVEAARLESLDRRLPEPGT
jgi:hypothetical protein